MTIPVKMFRSTDTGAPSLAGQAGSLIALLDACLKDGYNSKAVQGITRSGQTATVTFSTAHGFDADGLTVVRISGADQVEYNGDFRIENVTSTTFDITVTGTPATPATGTITAKAAPADWNKAFSGTNKAVYRTTDTSGGAQAFLRIDDSTTNYATANGYESMTDVDNGVDNFGSNRRWFKSSTADETSRPWVLVADARAFVLLTAFHATHANFYAPWLFGDMVSEVANDGYGALLLGHNSTTTPTPGTAVSHLTNSIMAITEVSGSLRPAGSIMRNGVGVTKNISAHLVVPFILRSSQAVGETATVIGSWEQTTSPSYMISNPNPPNGGVYANRIALFESSGGAAPATVGLRGWLPGVYAPFQFRPITNQTPYVSVSSQTAGRKFWAVHLGVANTSSQSGQCHIDITGPWR
jgi:hypothetical protein